MVFAVASVARAGAQSASLRRRRVLKLVIPTQARTWQYFLGVAYGGRTNDVILMYRKPRLQHERYPIVPKLADGAAPSSPLGSIGDALLSSFNKNPGVDKELLS